MPDSWVGADQVVSAEFVAVIFQAVKWVAVLADVSDMMTLTLPSLSTNHSGAQVRVSPLIGIV